MLISHTFPLKRVLRIHYTKTQMGRSVFFADISLPYGRTLCLGTTHLESLQTNPPHRPPQLALAARYLRDEDVDVGVQTGDMNAIQDFDRTLPAENGLNNAYLVTGEVEGAEEGMMRRQMAKSPQREEFWLSRMGKILFCCQKEEQKSRVRLG